jgi:hypothetical protein
VGVVVAGDVAAYGSGRVIVGDGLDDAAQIAFVNSSHLLANGGTIVLKPRVMPLALDAGSVGGISLYNGGTLALAGTSDLLINRDVDQSGNWVLANQSPNTLRLAGQSQDTTAGLTLRAESGVTRYEVDSVTLGAAPANGTVNVDLRGGTIDINNFAPAERFNYAPGYTVAGWGQLGTSAANQTHAIPFGGATFYASGPGGSTLAIVGGFDEFSGSKASFRIGDNDGLVLSVPNASPASAYSVGSVVIDPQGAGSVARFVVAGGAVTANSAAFVSANNRVRFEVQGGTLSSDVSQTGSLLVNTPGSTPINVTGNGTFITTSPTFLLKSGETLGTTGTLFAPSGAVTNLTLNGTVDLNGAIGGSINGASTGTIKLDAGESLTLLQGADLLSINLAYGGATGAPALIEVNAPGSTVRLGTGTALTVPDGVFNGTREFKVTAGTFQVDAADATSVNVTGVNQLSVDRTSNASADPALLGTLTLAGGAFQVGTSASTLTVAPGALLSGRGTLGHVSSIDTVVNNGAVTALGGSLTVSAAAVRGIGAWDPNGQTLTFTGAVQDVAAGSPTTLRIVGGNGGTAQLSTASSSYTGGTVIDGSAGATPLALRVTAAGALGSGPVTLNGGLLQINTDASLNFGANAVNVIGGATSGINYEHISGSSARTQTIGALSLGGQTLNLIGPPTSAYSYTLVVGGTTVSPAGATIVSTGGSASTVRLGALTLNGDLNLSMTSANFNVDALSGPGSITRASLTGTLILSKPAVNYTGNLFTSVGTTNFTGANTLGTGTYTFAGGNVNVTAASALNGATGAQTGGNLSLNAARALDGTSLTSTGGNIFTSSAGSLGTGTLQLNGGKLFLRSDAGTVFNGTINVTGNPGSAGAGSLTVDRSSAAGAGGIHTISALSVTDQTLNLAQGNAGYGLAVSGPTTIGGAAGGTINNNAAQLTLASLQVSSPFTLTGGGNATIGPLGGTATANFSSTGTVNFTGAARAGFGSTVILNTGVANVNDAASFSGGGVRVNGGTLNLGLSNALAGTQATLQSGFINANAPAALDGVSLTITNGTLLANANNALGNATVSLTGGNITATAPGALGAAGVTLFSNSTLALRSDTAAAFGGSVTLGGFGFSTISVAKLTAGGGTNNVLSINGLALGGQTLNVTGADSDTLAVVNPVNMTGTDPTTINTTASDALFRGALTGAGPLVKSGIRTLTLDGGGSFGATTVSAGTLVVNNSWTTPSVVVGTASAPATLELGGGGTDNPGAVTVNSGTLRIGKASIPAAVPAATPLALATYGDVKLEYAGGTTSTLANNLNVDTSLGARTLTLSAASGPLPTQVSTFTVGGSIIRTGAGALNVVAQADTALDDGFNNLVRAPSRLVIGGNQTFTTDLQHNGGIVIGKGAIPAGGIAGPFGTSSNPITMNVADSTIGGMVADGTSNALFTKSVTTASSLSPRKRLGAFFNPAGAAGTQTINFNGSFTWNDGSTPFYLITPAGNPGGAMAVSPWNGLFADPGSMLQVNSGAVLDNVLTATSSAVTSYAPIYVGGGGTVRFTTGIPRSLSQARGLAGTATILDNTLFQSNTTGPHFDGIELRTGTYQLGSTATGQTLAGGFAVSPSLFDATRRSSNLITDVDLSLTGVGAGAAFKIAPGQTLVKAGAAALNVNGDQLHGPLSSLQVNAGAVNFNTDAGMNNGAAPVNTLSVNVNNGALVNFAVSQHVAQLNVTSGVVRLASGAGLIEAAGVQASNGQLDLTDNRLIVDYTPGNDPITSINQQIARGYNAGGTLWGGSGIISSTAAASPTARGLGYAEASEALGAAGGTFGGEAVDPTAVLVRYTLLGDATLDGSVDFIDLVKLAQNYNTRVASTTSSWWYRGDFNYDGNVDFNDLVKLAQNYNTAFPGAPIPGATPAFEQDLAAAFAQAPEPGTLALLGFCAAAAQVRRRRRRTPRA